MKTSKEISTEKKVGRKGAHERLLALLHDQRLLPVRASDEPGICVLPDPGHQQALRQEGRTASRRFSGTASSST